MKRTVKLLWSFKNLYLIIFTLTGKLNELAEMIIRIKSDHPNWELIVKEVYNAD